MELTGLRLVSSGQNDNWGNPLPERQNASSIMPCKINTVILEEVNQAFSCNM